MNKKSHYNMRITILILMAYFLLRLFTFASYAGADDTSHSDLTKELTYTEQTELNDFDTLAKMIKDIFSFNKEKGDESVNDVGQLLYDLLDTGLEKFNKVVDTTLYSYIQGIALMFLMINFLIKVYQEFDIGLDENVFNREFIRECIMFLFALIAIIVLKYFVIFIFAFFRFLMDKMLYIQSTEELGSVVNITNNVKSDRIAYEILRESGLVGKTSLIEEVSIRSKEASLRTMYMIPWVSTWICKVGELIIVFVNAVFGFVADRFIGERYCQYNFHKRVYVAGIRCPVLGIYCCKERY